MDAAPLWRVTDIRDSSMILPNGGPVRTKRVSFVLADSTPSYVEVPLDSFTPPVVASEIERMARQHYAIIGLESTETLTQPGG